MAAHRDAVGQPGDFDAELSEQPGQVHGGGFPLGVRVGGHNHLFHAAGGHPGDQFGDPQVIRPHVVHRGNYAVENVVQPMVFAGALHGDDVLGVRHHADQGVVPLGAGTEGAGAVPLSEVLADGAAGHRAFGVEDGGGKGLRLLVGQV